MLLQGRGRKRCHTDYVNAILERDLKEITRIHQKNAMRELVHTLAAWSGKFMDLSAIGSGLSIRRPTSESYIIILYTGEFTHARERAIERRTAIGNQLQHLVFVIFPKLVSIIKPATKTGMKPS